jgi:DNA-binding IclR family transcriptional regulator
MESEATRKGHKKIVPAAQRALAVLELLMASRKGLAVSEIARSMGLARSTTFYIINTIEECGYIHRTSPRGRYTFTAKLLELASRSLGSLWVREPAAPFLRALMLKTGLTVHLGVIAQNEVVLIDKVAPAAGQQLATWVGKRMPIHCTGLGKALMAYLPEEQIQSHIKQGLIRYNENTIVSASRLKDELLRIRSHGYAIDDEEETVGLRCLGAPVFDKNKQAAAAISIAGTSEQLSDEKVDRLVRALKQAAASVSAELSSHA